MDLHGDDKLHTYKIIVVHSSKTPECHQRIKHLGTRGTARGLVSPSQHACMLINDILPESHDFKS